MRYNEKKQGMKKKKMQNSQEEKQNETTKGKE
jgi:hypothetical protein